MIEEQTIEKDQVAEVASPAEVAVGSDVRVTDARPAPSRGPTRDRRGAPGGRGNRPNRPGRPDRDQARSEFGQKIIGIRRVARVMAGGRRFNFSVCIVIGDKKGRVGVGLGKAADTALAIDKAARAARRNILSLTLTKNHSIKHNVESKYCASVVEIRPSPGRGLVAGSSVRTVLELAGVSDVTAKLLSRSKNPINNARAAIEALRKVSSAKGASVSDRQAGASEK